MIGIRDGNMEWKYFVKSLSVWFGLVDGEQCATSSMSPYNSECICFFEK